MKNLVFTFVLTLLLANPMLALSESKKINPSMKIYFYEFNLKTYGDITKENVEFMPNYEIYFYGRHKFIDKTIGFLTKNRINSSIDLNNIRLKVDILTARDIFKSYFVDNIGTVEGPDESYFKMTSDDMTRLQDAILEFHGVVDKKPETSPWGG